MLSFWCRGLSQHAWLKQLFEIALLIFGAGLLGSFARRWLRRWTERVDKKFHHSVIALLDRVITPLLALAVVTISFRLFPCGPRQ